MTSRKVHLLILFVCIASFPTEARWPRAARPGPRPQERRAQGLPLPRQLVPQQQQRQLVPQQQQQRQLVPQQQQRQLDPQQQRPQRPPVPARTARVTDWRKPKPLRTKKWGGRNYIFQDNRWKPLFEKPLRAKQARFVKPPLVKKPAPPRKAPYPGPRPNGIPGGQQWQKPATWPQTTRRAEPATTSKPIARTFPSYPANPNSIRRIDTGVVKDAVLAESLIPDVEIDGLQIYKFRGEDSMPGYIPPPNFLWSQARVTSSSFSELAATPPSVTPAPAPSRAPPTPHTWRPELPPPFPTRHTTRRPSDQQRNPVIIIAQSSVQKN